MTPLAEAVRAILAELPAGEVITYGELAREAGHPGAARAAGRVLRSLEGVPWWRVVNARGRVCPTAVAEATRRLEAEGVSVVDGHVRALASARRGAHGVRGGAAGRWPGASNAEPRTAHRPCAL